MNEGEKDDENKRKYLCALLLEIQRNRADMTLLSLSMRRVKSLSLEGQ